MRTRKDPEPGIWRRAADIANGLVLSEAGACLSILPGRGLKRLEIAGADHNALARVMGFGSNPPSTHFLESPRRGAPRVGGPGGVAFPSFKAVLLKSKDTVGTLAHEYGHLASREGHLGREVWGWLDLVQPTPAAVLAASMLAFSDPDSRTAKLAPYALALGWMPTLADEAMASIRGYAALSRHGVSVVGRALSASELALLRSQYIRAFSTYGLCALGSVLGIELARRFRMARKHIAEKSSSDAVKMSKAEVDHAPAR